MGIQQHPAVLIFKHCITINELQAHKVYTCSAYVVVNAMLEGQPAWVKHVQCRDVTSRMHRCCQSFVSQSNTEDTGRAGLICLPGVGMRSYRHSHCLAVLA